MAGKPVAEKPVIERRVVEKRRGPDLRGARYCDILGAKRQGDDAVVSIYSTLGLNDCPEERWRALTEAKVQDALKVSRAMLNGPRYFVMDRIADQPMDGTDPVDVGGIRFRKRAEVVVDLRRRTPKELAEMHVARSAMYVFDAGKPIFILTAPDKARYVMQSYAQIVDPKLVYGDLPHLGPKLKLGKGWSYHMELPKRDLVVTASGSATVILDRLRDAYQRLPDGGR